MPTDENETVTASPDVIEETPEESVDIDAPDVVLGDSETEVTEEGDTVVDAGDTVVVVDAPAAPAQSDAVIEQVIDDAVSLATLTERVNELDSRLFALETREAVEAEEDAEILDAIEDEEESEDSDDDGEFIESGPEPKSAKAHPLFRPFSEWRNK